MRITENVEARIRARDRATSLLNELTAGVVIAGVGALGVFGFVDAITVPGTTSSSTASTGTSSSASTGASTQAGLQPAPGSISSSSSGSGIVVSGGS